MDAGKSSVGCSLVHALALFRAQAQARAVFPVQQHRLVSVAQVKVPGRVAHEHHRELQTLGAMDGHNGHTARPRTAGHSVLPGRTGLRRRVDGTHQRRDAVCTGLCAESRKAPGIFPAVRTVFQYAQRSKIAGGDKDLFQQLFCRGTAGHAPQCGEPVIKVFHLSGERRFIVILHHLQHCAVQTHAGSPFARFLRALFLLRLFLHCSALGTQAYKVVVRKAEHRPQHGGGKVDILRRVVDDLQKRDQRPDVRCFHQVFARIRIHRDAPGRERFLISEEVAARRQQDAAILVLHRAGGAAVPHWFAVFHQFFNALGDPRRVGLSGVVGQEVRFHAAGVFAGCTAHQPLAVTVSRIAQLGCHELFKDKVDACHHLWGGAEVRIQRQQSVSACRTLLRAGAGSAAGQRCPCVQLSPEDAGVGLTEAVDALLQVAHKEQVIPRRGSKAAVNGILQSVRVLIFVHHHGGIAVPDALAQRGAHAIRCAQQPQGLMLKIAEFQQLALLFLCREAGIKIPHGGKHRPQPGQGRSAVRFGFLLAAGDKLRNVLKQLGGFVCAGPDRRLMIAGQPFFHALEAGHLLHAQHIGCQLIVQRCPLPCRSQPFHLAQQGGGAFQPGERLCKFIVDTGHGLCLGSSGLAFFLGLYLCKDKIFLTVCQRCRQQFPRGLCAAGRFRQQQVMPAGKSKAVFPLPWCQIFVQPAVVVRQSAQKIVHMQDGIACGLIGAALSVKVCKGTEVRVAVGIFQRFGQRRSPQHLHAAGVCRGKVRRDVQCLKVLVQQVQTERVNGADGCSLQKHPLAAQARVVGLLLAEPQQCLPDACPQLCRRRIGKGDDEQFVRIHRVVRIGDEPHRAFGQHGRFAAARRCAHQQRTTPVLNSSALGRSPFGLTHACSPSFPSSASSGSKGLAGASSARSPMPVSWQQIKL